MGHSQGGMMPRYYMRFLGGAAKVHELIGMAPSNHGTTQRLAPIAGPLCPACAQQAAGSAFITNLNAGGEIEPGVDYTVIVTRYDEVVMPYRSQYLNGPSAQITNITLQSKCLLDIADHLLIIYDYPGAAMGRARAPSRRSGQPIVPPVLRLSRLPGSSIKSDAGEEAPLTARLLDAGAGSPAVA